MRKNCRDFGVPLFDLGEVRAGHRSRHRPRARPVAARHDDRLRRQPHCDPRRVRRAGLRHRHQRSRARAGDAMPVAGAAEDDGSPRRRQARSRASPPRTSFSASSGASRTDGGTGHVIEYRGTAIEALSMEERMTVCNMSIEGGARAGMIARRSQDRRLPARPPISAERCGIRSARRAMADATHRRGREVRSQHQLRRRRHSPRK